MQTKRLDEIYRVRVETRLKKTLAAVLRDPLIARPPKPAIVRIEGGAGAGGYTATLFVTATALLRLAKMAELCIVESANLSARLRQGPLSAIEAGLEAAGYSAVPMSRFGKFAPLPAH